MHDLIIQLVNPIFLSLEALPSVTSRIEQVTSWMDWLAIGCIAYVLHAAQLFRHSANIRLAIWRRVSAALSFWLTGRSGR
ncbi:hypothetical protein [Plantactinospora sp. WMMB782]|uniref:hypothetical protein n=1 Tax=Plantactinospora sp. WMMB782 TaxID=3404121 RepID=UPI003B941C05